MSLPDTINFIMLKKWYVIMAKSMWTPEHSPYCFFSQDFIFTRRIAPIQPQEVKVWLTVVSHIHSKGGGEGLGQGPVQSGQFHCSTYGSWMLRWERAFLWTLVTRESQISYVIWVALGKFGLLTPVFLILPVLNKNSYISLIYHP